jgi:ParB-like chromosome segregation protein Spo0J
LQGIEDCELANHWDGKIACHILELDDKNAFEVSLVENIHRKTLSSIEEAEAFKAYISDFGWPPSPPLNI